MKLPQKIAQVALLGICLLLLGCERDNYTTWNCNTAAGNKSTMILRKAQMEFAGSTLNFCGSLGNQSYFNEKCPAQTAQSKAVFTPSTGLLLLDNQTFQCSVL